MSKAKIVFADRPNGRVRVTVSFDPPLYNNGQEVRTPAQASCLKMLGHEPLPTSKGDSGIRRGSLDNLTNREDLPADLADAFDQMRLAILHHNISGWQQISQGDLLNLIETLASAAVADPNEGGGA